METGYFYFLKNQFFTDFHYPYLFLNKERDQFGEAHNRPCYAVLKNPNTQICWMIPCTSQVRKYRRIYNIKVAKYHFCDTIVFGEVLGKEAVFLIQNMFPITETYIQNQYTIHDSDERVSVAPELEKELVHKAKKVLSLQKHGAVLIFPDIFSIEHDLLAKEGKEG